ncbi:hypothetical protein [Spirillospora sp. CA-294931]|uniref:hypothetical protein n=1 Tax=Spirillospora sp. CA-294931 TaxID=3240042 RepID=UPI003D8D7866
MTPRTLCAMSGGLSLALIATTPASAGPSRWRDVPSPALASVVTLSDVTATGPANAWAVGWDKAPAPVILRWNGRDWTRQPVPEGTAGRLTGVTASGPRRAWAVADPYDSPAGSAVALFWNGRTWNKVGYPADLQPGPVSAAPGRPAWSLGWNSSTNTASALRFLGGTWVRQPVPLPAESPLWTLSARAENDVWIGGAKRRDDGYFHPYALHWDGRAWQEVPPPAETWTYIRKIVPVSPTSVWAYRTDLILGQDHTLMHWDGTTWRTIPIPVAPGPQASLADDGRGGVWVAGSAGGKSVYQHYRDGVWTTANGPARPDKRVSAYAITGSLWSVGDLTGEGGTTAYIERYR